MVMHNEEGKSLLLDPRFLIQIAGILLSFAGLYFGLVTKVDVVVSEQTRQGAALSDIQKNLPNREAEDLKYQQLKADVVALREEVRGFDGWVRVTREQLIKKGVI